MTHSIKLPVKGMTCGNCAAHVERALKGVDGVTAATVNLEEGWAMVQTDIGGPSLSDLIEAVHVAGYEVPTESVDLSVVGMTCDHCVRRVANSLSNVVGVVEADVDLDGAKAAVTSIAGQVELAALEQAVVDAGYQTA
jgi:Cu+-exporting ATPase